MKINKKEDKFFREQTESFDTLHQNKSTLDLDTISVAEQDQLDLLLKIFKNSDQKSLLDLGCGTGTQSLRLAPYFKNVVGLDPSKKSISIARKTAAKYKIKNFKGAVGSLNNSVYRQSFDFILMTNVIHHVEDVDRLLRKCRVALRPGGTLVIFEQNPLNPLFIPFLYSLGMLSSHMNMPYLRSNMFTLKNILTKNNFKSIKLKRYAFLPSLLYSYSPIFKTINEKANKVPVLNIFAAFHIFVCKT